MCIIVFSLLINAVILLLNCLVLILYLCIYFVSLLKHHLDLNITDTALNVSRSLYCFTTSVSHGVDVMLFDGVTFYIQVFFDIKDLTWL